MWAPWEQRFSSVWLRDVTLMPRAVLGTQNSIKSYKWLLLAHLYLKAPDRIKTNTLNTAFKVLYYSALGYLLHLPSWSICYGKMVILFLSHTYVLFEHPLFPLLECSFQLGTFLLLELPLSLKLVINKPNVGPWSKMENYDLFTVFLRLFSLKGIFEW